MNEATAIIFDCEFLTSEDVPRRHWCGPLDPDPLVVQIGAVKLDLTGNFEIKDTCRLFIKPIDRHGRRYALDPFFTQFTGIGESDLIEEGLTLSEALSTLDSFSEETCFWSWGKDELNMVAVSCFIAGLPVPIPANRFGNACTLMLKAGMPYADIKQTRSSGLATYYGLDASSLKKHDGLDDALSLAYALQHLLRQGKIMSEDLLHTDG